MKRNPIERLLWVGYLSMSGLSFVLGIYVLIFNGFEGARDTRYDIVGLLMLIVPWVCIRWATTKSKWWLILGFVPFAALFLVD